MDVILFSTRFTQDHFRATLFAQRAVMLSEFSDERMNDTLFESSSLFFFFFVSSYMPIEAQNTHV